MRAYGRTLDAIEEVLAEAGGPLSPVQIVERARGRLPTRAKLPQNVVARDLSVDIRRLGERSRFVRIALGIYDLRARVALSMSEESCLTL